MTLERLQSVHSVLLETDERLKAGQAAGAKLWLSGFGALDTAMSGGFRSGELVLLGGAQGLGKTTFAMQVLRNLTATGHSAVYFSFDHDHHTLIERLIAMEAAEVAGSVGVPLKSVREAFEARHRREPTMEGRPNRGRGRGGAGASGIRPAPAPAPFQVIGHRRRSHQEGRRAGP